MTKERQISFLYDNYRLEFQQEQVVQGSGNLNASVLFVGEAPGKEEVKLSKPFVGAAGKNLETSLSLIGLGRDDIYVTNAIKYRLSKTNPDTGRVSNRPTKPEDIRRSRDYLIEEISIINPSIIVSLGNVPLNALTGDSKIIIGTVHGKLRRVELVDKEFWLFPLYHPASIIYNRSLKTVYQEDLMVLAEIIKGI